uniref:NADH dehydrogenase subunit 6 n=1 Tax=Mukaria splendida TaxID=2586309 RepID=A0A7L8ZU47_9HEMI|nr:NADH dehydrogenase subunit 6 [Mukaria splendida]QOI73925.1 NADH dehydrogenase subunit 6 [Mukaria splendida]
MFAVEINILLMKFMMMISLIIPFLNTPMSMGVFLMLQTILSTMFLLKISFSSWMPMIIFLMLIGGLMILFMYMSSIASNEKFLLNYKLVILPMLMLMLPLENMMTEIMNNEFLMNNLDKNNLSMMKFYNKKTMMLTLLMFMYMLVTMIVVTKITKIHKGPLRSK